MVPRVAAVISADGQVNTSTAITGVFNTNNIRSVATVNGNTLYISGQGASKTDPTQGLFVAQEGATTATPIYNTTDTRIVEIYDGQLYVSQDYNPPGSGAQNDTSVSAVGSGLPTGASSLTHITPPASPYSSGGNNGSINLTTSLKNNVNASRVGSFVYLSPESYFFASPDVLYVADSGQPKNGNANKAALGEGGLQKWVLDPTTGVWSLAYDMYLDLSPNLDGVDNNANANSNAPTDPGVTGLYGLTGEVVNGQVELFATSYGLNELSPSYLYENHRHAEQHQRHDRLGGGIHHPVRSLRRHRNPRRRLRSGSRASHPRPARHRPRRIGGRLPSPPAVSGKQVQGFALDPPRGLRPGGLRWGPWPQTHHDPSGRSQALGRLQSRMRHGANPPARAARDRPSPLPTSPCKTGARTAEAPAWLGGAPPLRTWRKRWGSISPPSRARSTRAPAT